MASHRGIWCWSSTGRNLDGHKTNWNYARRNSSFPARKENIDGGAFTRAVEKLAVSHRIDGTWVERTDHRQRARLPVTLYTVHEGGHTVPGPARAPFVLGGTSQDVSTVHLVASYSE
ncbi:hypothetical protein AB0465_25350 [Streptomyces griseoviridis]|uniref:hypothetical protein n=1 Tax=Streptomyces griseoviridis TaxID=45398 RepID=UPI003450B56E